MALRKGTQEMGNKMLNFNEVWLLEYANREDDYERHVDYSELQSTRWGGLHCGDPLGNCDGGELDITDAKVDLPLPLQQEWMVVFKASTSHQVRGVTSGLRYSIALGVSSK